MCLRNFVWYYCLKYKEHKLTNTPNTVVLRSLFFLLIGSCFLFTACKKERPPTPTEEQELLPLELTGVEVTYEDRQCGLNWEAFANRNLTAAENFGFCFSHNNPLPTLEDSVVTKQEVNIVQFTFSYNFHFRALFDSIFVRAFFQEDGKTIYTEPQRFDAEIGMFSYSSNIKTTVHCIEDRYQVHFYGNYHTSNCSKLTFEYGVKWHETGKQEHESTVLWGNGSVGTQPDIDEYLELPAGKSYRLRHYTSIHPDQHTSFVVQSVATPVASVRSLPALPGPARAEATAFSVGNMGYVFGGYNAERTEVFADLWVYDPQQGRWEEQASGPQALAFSTSFVIDNQVFIGSGSKDPANPEAAGTNAFWHYDAQADNWTRIADFPQAGAHSCSSFAIDGIGYVGLCATESGVSNQFWSYSVADDRWEEISPLPKEELVSARNAAVVVAGVAHVLLDPFREMWTYDPSTENWQYRDRLIDSQDDAVVLNHRDKIYVLTGRNNTYLAVYDLQSGWKRYCYDREFVRTEAVGFVLNDRLLLGTGSEYTLSWNDIGEQVFNDFYEIVLPQ